MRLPRPGHGRAAVTGDECGPFRSTPAPETGVQKLESLAAIHLRELTHLAPTVRNLWRALEGADHDRANDVGLVW